VTFINIDDTSGNEMILSLKRISKVKLEAPVEGDNDDAGTTCITLEATGKDGIEEYVFSSTSVEDIWAMIKLRM